uniref:Large polyvalent protein associated domain-containing protein n=1 Tax=viral metagenome TaxID=1070528 RepID=A0A6M3KNR9_9ZZZZ
MVTERQVQYPYKSELEKLSPEERTGYTDKWRTFLTKLPYEAYTAQLTRATRQFGPEFAAELIQPEILEPTQETPETATAPSTEIEPELPWYAKPLKWASEQPALKPLFKGLEWYQQNWLTPAAMFVAQPFSPKLQAQLGKQSPWELGAEKRQELWSESELPWLMKTGFELAVDPTTYFGWGLAAKAGQTAAKAGLTGLARAIKPIASLEEAYIKAAALPVKGAAKVLKKLPPMVPDIPYFRATGQFRFGRPLAEAPQSIVRNLSVHSHNALTNMELAGEQVGKPFSQVLRDIQSGFPDERLLSTITNPRQKDALNQLITHSKELGIDEIIGVADKNPISAKAIIGMRQAGLKARELGLAQPKLATGLLGTAQSVTNKLYNLWRRTVLQSPYYVLQNTIENPIREILVGVRPMWDIMDIVNSPQFKNFPIEMQRIAVGLKDRWNKTIPSYLESPLARTPGEGVLTQALAGALTSGKAMPATTVASFMDSMAMLNTYQAKRSLFYRNLMETASAETRASLAKVDDLVGTLISRATDGDLAGVVEPRLLEHLKGISATGSIDDILHEFSKVSKDKTFTVARAMTDQERALPEVLKSTIKNDLPRAWARNDIKEIERIFNRIEKMLPETVETHQKQLLVQRLRTYRDLLRNQVPPQYRPYLTKILNRFKYDKVTEAEAKLASAKSLTEYERALFKAHVQSRAELETLTEWNLLTEAMAQNIPPNTLAHWFVIADDINTIARTEGLELAAQTFRVADIVRHAKDPSKIQKAWDSYIMEIQSLAPDLADTMRIASPNNDLLWHTYRATQEQRWFRVGQDKLRESGIHLTMPKTIDATGKIITQEDFMANQIKAVRSWKDRAIDAWEKRHAKVVVPVAPTLPQKTIDILSEQRDFMVRNRTARGGIDNPWRLTVKPKLEAAGLPTKPIDDKVGAYMNYRASNPTDVAGQNKLFQEIIDAFEPKRYTPKATITPTVTTREQILDELREQVVKTKESISLQETKIANQASDLALDATYTTFGNYAQRTNLDELMTGLGVPFWFFPSRSIPFYTTQMLQHPRLGVEILNMQQSKAESEQPSRLIGSINIPGTNYWYNPLQSTMLWQLVGQPDFSPAAAGGLQGTESWIRNNLQISLGPHWRIASAIIERVMGKQAGTGEITLDPQPIIPQQRWLSAVAGLKLPIISPLAGFLNEPFDMYLRAVYGDSVANWMQREVEKTIVDMGYNPQDAPDEVIEKAWDRYYTRQLLSIPGGAVKEMTPTELARFEAINEKATELGLTKAQRATLRASGESPFTGLRQDQLEALYEDVPAQKLWRYIRPYGLTAKSKPIWEDYISVKLGRETLLYGKDPNNPTEGSRLYKERQYDQALLSGKISPREWKTLYRQSYGTYLDQVKQLERDFPQAPKTDADWEAYRELLGWDNPVRHPDDLKLDEYYDVMDSSNFESDLGEFEYDKYRQTEAAFFQNLEPSTISYIKSRKDRYKTPLRAAYSRDMEKVQPYYELQDAILREYSPYLSAILEQALAAPDPAIQRGILIGYPQATLALRRIRIAKQQLRQNYPELDRILRFWSS